MATEYMLTTIDNPYNPFENIEQWRLFDIEKGYFTCEHLARLANITDDMSQKEIDDECVRAMDRIVFDDPLNIYKKVTESSYSSPKQNN